MASLQGGLARYRSQTDPLPPLVALDELIALESSAPPDATLDRSSLTRDVAAALDAQGEAVRASAAVALADFRSHTLARLPSLLSTAAGIQVAAAAARVLHARLIATAGVTAAWHDVIAAFRDDASRATRSFAVACLRDAIKRRGHVWATDSPLIAGVLADRAADVVRARAALGLLAADRSDVVLGGDGEDAGLSAEERLALAERYVTRPPRDEDVIVWLAVRYTAIEGRVMELGSVRFIEAEALGDREFDPPFVFAPAGHSSEQAACELADVRERLLDGVPDDVAFARVHTTTRGGDPVRRARQLVSGLLDAAMLRTRNVQSSPHGLIIESTWSIHPPTWRLLDGHLLVSPTGWSGAGRVGTTVLSRIFTEGKPVPRTLQGLDEKLAIALERGRRDALDAAELIRWERVLDDAPDDEVRVALGVRNLERALQPERVAGRDGRAGHWTEVATYYLRDMWCWRSAGATFLTLAGASGWPTGELVEAWLHQLVSEFDVQIARAARQRNGAVHGAVMVPAAIASVVPFVASLGQSIMLAAVTAVAEERPLGEWLEDRRLLLRERRAALANDPAPAELHAWLDDAVPGTEADRR